MGFLDRLFGPEIDEGRLEPHRARAGELAAQLVSRRGLDDAERRRWMRRLPDTDDVTLVSLAVVLADELRRSSVGADAAMAQLAVLARTPLPFQPDDVGVLVELAGATEGTWRRRILSVATTGAETLSARGFSAIDDAVTDAVRLLGPDVSQEGVRLRGRLLALVPGDTVGALAFDMVAPGDEWSRQVRPSFDARFSRDPIAHALLELMASLRQPAPRQIWLRRSAELATGSEGRAGELAALLLGALLDLKPTGTGRPAVNPTNAELLRGAVWVAVSTGEPWVVRLLVDVRRRSRELRVEKVANASLAALGHLGTPEAVTELAQQWWAARRRGARIDIERALAQAGAGAHDGVTVPALLEPHIPIRSTAHRVEAERRRIDATLSDDRAWDLPMWTVRYLEHRITGPLARTLVWTLEAGPHRWAVMPGDGAGSFRLVDDSTVAAPADAIVRPWHPLLADQVEIDAWADHLARRGLTQAVEQVRRPVYRPGPDEPPEATETHRFAERVVDGRRCIRALGEARWFRAQPGDGRFEVDLEPVGDGRGVVGAVRFPVPFSRLPPMVFSEAMLDVARAIAAGSIRE